MTTIPGVIVPILGLRFKMDVSTTRLERVPDACEFQPLEPGVEFLPDPVAPDDPNAPAWQHRKWMAFPDTWGMRLLGGFIHACRYGPGQKGLKWHNPFAWMERYCTPDYLVY